MREIAVTRQYKKDVERLLKQGKNMAKLNEVAKIILRNLCKIHIDVT